MQPQPRKFWSIELAIEDLGLVLFASVSIALVSVCYRRLIPTVNAREGTYWNGPRNAKAMIVQKARVALNAVRPRLSLPSLAMVLRG